MMLTTSVTSNCTAFNGTQRLAAGSLQEVVPFVKQAVDSGAADAILIFDDASGKLIDIDLRASSEEIYAHLSAPSSETDQVEQHDDAKAFTDTVRGRGRPKLGVIAREVTLLPRHWDWLATQPGGASVTLRKLVEEARRTQSSKDQLRHAQERAYRFMSAIAGDMPGFEEATRALFAHDQDRFEKFMSEWSKDVRDYAIWLASIR